MTQPTDASADPHHRLPDPDQFWAYSASLYSQPGIKEGLLGAQDSGGLDVNLTLLLLWCDRLGVPLSDDAMIALKALSHYWQSTRLNPKRAARRQAKGTSSYSLHLEEELTLERAAQTAYLEAAHTCSGTGTDRLDAYIRALVQDTEASSLLKRLREAHASAGYPCGEDQTDPAPD